MVDRRTAESPEYQEGYNSAKVNDGDATKAHNPHIAGTSPWVRWGIGWDDCLQETEAKRDR